MDFVIGMLIGIIGATIVCVYWPKIKNTNLTMQPKEPSRNLMDEAKEKHAEQISKVEEFIKGKSEVTNDEVQNYLNCSDASAERYLNELESQGKLKQIGKTGRATKYQVMS